MDEVPVELLATVRESIGLLLSGALERTTENYRELAQLAAICGVPHVELMDAWIGSAAAQRLAREARARSRLTREQAHLVRMRCRLRVVDGLEAP